MSLKKNILANYAGQLYVTLIGIVTIPLLIKYMGTEAYGLVGFFAMLQAWFQLADMGLTPTMARAAARYTGGAYDARNLRQLLRTLEAIFIGVALVGSIIMIVAAKTISINWLKVQELPIVEVQNSIALMSVVVACRWICGLYRGIISGFERLVWLSAFNSLISTARFVLVVPFLIFVGASPTHFFCYQVVLAAIELLILVVKTYKLMPNHSFSCQSTFQWSPLRGVLKFSLSLAFTSLVWVMATQIDKLVLSTLLPLTEYASFTLAILVASAVMFISGPISSAILPRLTKLAAQNDKKGFTALYRETTQMVVVIVIPTAATLAFFSEQVLWSWTGNADITRQVTPILALYAIGNGILTIGAFPYYLQIAKGDLKLHLIGNACFVILHVPALIWTTLHYGMAGAGWAWVTINSVYFLTWLPLVHRRFFKGLHLRWLMCDIGVIALPTVFVAAMIHYVVQWPKERFAVAICAFLVGLLLMVVAASQSTAVKKQVHRLFVHKDLDD